MKTSHFLLIKLCLGTSVLAGCSNQQIYQAIQQSQVINCEEAPFQIQQACRDQYSLSYENYHRMRQEIIMTAENSGL